MTPKNFSGLASFLGIFSLLFLCGCGAATKSTDPSSYTTQTISGSVSFSNIQSLRTLMKPFTTTNYFLWVQNRATKRVYFVELNPDGSFSLPVEIASSETNGKNFFMALVQKDPLEFLGPVILSSPTGKSEGSTGVTISGDVSNMIISFDGNKKRAVMSTENVTNLRMDGTFKTRFDGTNGKPVGMGNAGKGSESLNGSVNAANTIDQDEDGIPDMFDAMNNGSKLDNAISGTEADMIAHSSKITQATMFMNLKIDKSNAFTVTSDATIVLQFKSNTPSTIDSIDAFMQHTNYKSAKIAPIANGFTQVDTYPTTGTTWSSNSYRLFKARNLNNDTLWTVFLTPENNDFKPGNLLLMRVTYKDGSKEYFWMSLNFKFQTILTDTTSGTLSGTGTLIDPYVIADSGGQAISFQGPKDENGNTLTDLEYSLEMFFYDSGHNQVGERQVISIGKDITSYTLTEDQLNLYNTQHAKYIQIDLTARYPYGDNAATKIYLKRQSW